MAISLAICILLALLAPLTLAVTPPLGDVNCTPESCETIVCPEITCPFGKLMNSPSSPCSCCKLCLGYIEKNGTCGPNLSDRECGPGLYCTPTGSNGNMQTYHCLKMQTDCFRAQDIYEIKRVSGSLGMYEGRPNCDDSGDFSPRMCQPGGSCYCIDKHNNRIFGESPPSNASQMNCACSREYQTADESGLLAAIQFPHCTFNGNYDAFQCVGQACFCINPLNLTVMSDIVPITESYNLPCYDPAIHFPNYFRPCEMERRKAQYQYYSYALQNITVLAIPRPECSPDGYYKPVRQTESTLYCADPYGNKIEHFQVQKDDPSAATMNCNCARSRYWLMNENLAKPICSNNGNYRPYQCRGGVCFCVDSSGNQIGQEVQAPNIPEC